MTNFASWLQSMPFSAAPARTSVRRPLLWLALGFTVGSACLIGLTLSYLRTQAIESGVRLTQSFAQVIEEQTARTIQTVDQQLQLGGLGLASLAASSRLNEHSAHLLLRQRVKELPFVRAIWVLDAQGRIKYDSDEGNIGVSLADRAYFQIYRTQPQTEFYLGNPVRSRSTGTWLISAARPLKSADGSFAGIIVAAVEPPYFDKLWRSIDLGPDSSIGLFRSDGTLMMRSPFDDAAMAKVFADTRLFRELLPRNPSGSYQAPSVIDGTLRSFAYRTLSTQPSLLVMVGQSYELMLTPWRNLATLALSIWVIAAGAVCLLCVFLNRTWQQRLRAEDTLRQSEQRFKLAASTGNVWDWNVLTGQVTLPQEFWCALGYDGPDIGDPTAMLASVLHPQDLAHWRQAIKDHIRQRLPYDVDFRARAKSGEYRWFNTKGQARWDENGRATYMAGTTFDITEPKRTQEALREKEFLLSESQRLAHIGSWQIELATGKISWTEEAYRIYGIEAQTFTHNMASFYPLVHEDDQAAMKEWGRACRAGEQPGELEFRAILPDGSLRFLTGFGTLQYDAEQQPLRMIGTVQDITERKRALDTIRARETFISGILGSISDGLLALDKDWRYTFVNDQIVQRTGKRREELFDQSVWELFPEAQGMEVRQIFQRAMTERIPLDYEVYFPPFKKWLSGKVYPTSDGGLVAYSKDVTDRKQAEAALLASEEHLRLTTEMADIAVWEYDFAAGQMARSANHDKLYGLPWQEQWDINTFQLATHPQDRERSMELIQRSVAVGGPNEYSFDFRVIWPDASTHWLWVRGQVVDRDADGRGTRVRGVLLDISERKRANADREKSELEVRRLHEELQAHAAVLEQRVIERTAELETAKVRAEAADRMKSAFLAAMSHELRTPLNSIIGFTGVLLQQLPGPLNAEQEKQLGIVQNAGRHLLALICDVLDISKVEAGELNLTHERLDLCALCERMAAAFAPQAERRKLTLMLDLDRIDCIAYGDGRRVEQVLNNLLSNALKFTPSGQITLAYRREGNRFVVSVTDTGIGIKADDMDKLFRPFGQIETGLAGLREGTGLGLAISKHLVEAMGGEVAASSEWGKGSCFRFTLSAKEVS